MPDYAEMLERIIAEEKEVIGRPAVKLARDLGIEVNEEEEVTGFEGEGDEMVDKLIEKYKRTTGPVAERIASRALSDFDYEPSSEE